MCFQGACIFNTQKFAQLLDSMVRVSRRIQISKKQNDHNRERRGQRTGRGQNGEEGRRTKGEEEEERPTKGEVMNIMPFDNTKNAAAS